MRHTTNTSYIKIVGVFLLLHTTLLALSVGDI